jgi:hypothetical protein
VVVGARAGLRAWPTRWSSIECYVQRGLEGGLTLRMD